MRQRASLVDWIQQQKDNDLDPVIDPEIANEAMRLPYRELTLEQFRGLVDSVRNIEQPGAAEEQTAENRRAARVCEGRGRSGERDCIERQENVAAAFRKATRGLPR